MGSGASSNRKRREHHEQATELGIPVEQNMTYVEHYLPPTFPIDVTLHEKMLEKCRFTWGILSNGTAQGMSTQVGRAGIVLLYDEFYFRLFKRAKRFEEIFASIQQRGEVLMKAMEFLLALDGDDREVERKRLYYLGRSHRFKKGVRPWHFSVYAETLLETIMFWLGSDANSSVGEAWTNLFAYVLKRMLKAYLVNRVIENEYYQNSDIEALRKINQQSVYTESKRSQSDNGDPALIEP
mmetsp:Transcript_14342/g.21101  ORF Transcript_14342/g.21101 Transcript_14342/m.21101 type:complete len:239 (-) Transcript_14342:134-850(-)|eukprot:CAMPEP_0113934408 /NCGR_PEP_ID=MMETSP1339-20121228/1738_1 /TAXON_ID=94617 /ORGANISM="Fibrocapsa japonica" /LENGTH=238 /DNA_ID=CAMNT_0000936201 /DNA_START=107 /DNA_END=823 /DNA_ORIENTATION=- /assembly_acc=CAM_ASM_000762